jgi:TldD protein
MISREPTLERLAIARQLLLEPFGLDETDLAKTLAEIKAHKVDEADLYFQYTRAEGWSLEEGIVKTGSFSIDQGVGVRAVSGEKTAFAYSDDISKASLMDAARTVRTIAKPTPVLPEVGSMIVPPALSAPDFSAASTIAKAMRSLIEPPGLVRSDLIHT